VWVNVVKKRSPIKTPVYLNSNREILSAATYSAHSAE
jgi:hypothetical protein